MICRPTQSLIAEKYAELLTLYPKHEEPRPVGMVYRFGVNHQGIKGGLILHNATNLAPSPDRCGSSVCWTESGTPRTMQRYTTLLMLVRASSWEPINSSRTKSRVNLPSVLDLVKRVSDASQLRVILCLRQLWASTKSDCIIRINGHRWLVVTQEDLAGFLNLNVGTVKRAVRALRDDGVLDVCSSNRKNAYRILDFIKP